MLETPIKPTLKARKLKSREVKRIVPAHHEPPSREETDIVNGRKAVKQDGVRNGRGRIFWRR